MKLGQIIKEYRKEHRITQQEFADRSGLSKGYISMLENDRNPATNKGIIPSPSTIYGCADAMGMSKNDLFRKLDTEVIYIDYGEKELPVESERTARLLAYFYALQEPQQDNILNLLESIQPKSGDK